MRVANEAEFILNRMRADDVQKHAEFEVRIDIRSPISLLFSHYLNVLGITVLYYITLFLHFYGIGILVVLICTNHG